MTSFCFEACTEEQTTKNNNMKTIKYLFTFKINLNFFITIVAILCWNQSSECLYNQNKNLLFHDFYNRDRAEL